MVPFIAQEGIKSQLYSGGQKSHKSQTWGRCLFPSLKDLVNRVWMTAGSFQWWCFGPSSIYWIQFPMAEVELPTSEILVQYCNQLVTCLRDGLGGSGRQMNTHMLKLWMILMGSVFWICAAYTETQKEVDKEQSSLTSLSSCWSVTLQVMVPLSAYANVYI